MPNYKIHPIADVHPQNIGENTAIWQFSVILKDAKIGENVTFTNDFLPSSKQRPVEFLQTTLKKDLSLGANATVVGGVTIGQYAMVGVCSIVTLRSVA